MILGEVKGINEKISDSVIYDCDNLAQVAEIVESVGLPAGDRMDKDTLIMMLDDGSIDDDDLMEALVLMTNALLKIRNLLY